MSEEGLPSYARPPVYEVGLAAQFDTDVRLSTAALYRAQALFEAEFPDLEEVPSAPAIPTRMTVQSIEFSVLDTPPQPRLWFVSADGDRLVQLQHNRLVVNWRRHKGDEHYPRYQFMRTMFADAWSKLEVLTSDLKLGRPRVNMCEVVYVNPIEANDVWSRKGELHKVFRFWNTPGRDEFLPEPEDVAVSVSYPLPAEAGWLQAQVAPATKAGSDLAVYLMTMTARGRARSSDPAAAFEFFDLGHEWIVRGFTSLTTSEMHKRWGREQ